MQVAERDNRNAETLQAQVNELQKAIGTLNQNITHRQSTPSDEEQTKLLGEMEQLQDTSIKIKRAATLRLEHITSF